MDPNRPDMPGILRDMCDGSREAFERFYGRYAPLVMGVALRVLGDRMEAEDCCHDVFLEVLRKGSRYDASRGSIDAWLAVMTRSRCMDRLRRKRKIIVDRVEEELAGRKAGAAGIDPEEAAVMKLQRDALSEALQQLPGVQQRALVGAYYEAKSHREMADGWNVPIGTVKSWVRYGLRNMRKQLARKGWTDSGEGGRRYGEDGNGSLER